MKKLLYLTSLLAFLSCSNPTTPPPDPVKVYASLDAKVINNQTLAPIPGIDVKLCTKTIYDTAYVFYGSVKRTDGAGNAHWDYADSFYVASGVSPDTTNILVNVDSSQAYSSGQAVGMITSEKLHESLIIYLIPKQ